MGGRADVLVIGGGVVGVCTAWSLAQRGIAVTLLERGEICSGCSYGNAGWIFPSHSTPLPAPGAIRQGLRWLLDGESPFYIRPRASGALLRWLWRFRAACNDARMRSTFRINRELGQASHELFAKLAALPELEFGYAQRGLLLLCRSAETLVELADELALLRELGGEGTPLSRDEVLERVSAASPGLAGGVYFPADGHVAPADFVRGLARAAAERGAVLRTSTEVLELEVSGGRVSRVRTTRGDLACGELVLAGGAWSPELVAPLGIELPVQAAKGYSVTYGRPDGFGEVPVMLTEAKVGVTPMGETLRIAGTLELAGLDLSLNRRRVDAIERSLASYLPGLGALEHVETWRGLRPLTPDDLPVIGRPRGVQNLVLATGHGMGGLCQGPITGELVAQLLCGEAPTCDLAPLSPDRFA